MDPARKALARKVLLGIGGVTAVAAVGFGVWNSISNRPPKFARVIAEDLPADAAGLVAFADPAHTLALFDEAMPADVRAELEKELGFDPFLVSSYADLGFDLAAPVGVGVVGVERPVFVFTMGLDDASKARETIETQTGKAGVHGWEQRQFAGVDGMWLAEPPVAVLFRDDRLIVVGTEDNEKSEVERVADKIAELRGSDSLAATNGFRGVHRFEGDPILLAYINIAELGNTMMAAATVGNTDVESMAFAVTRDDRDIHFISQTVMSRDSNYLGYLDGRSRSTAALDRVPGPVYAGMHWSIDPEYLRELMKQLGTLGKSELENAQREAESELGVNFEEDILAAWTGEFGVLWTGAGEGEWGGLGFVGVHDEAAAEDTLERVWAKTEGTERESTNAGTIFRWDHEGAAKIWDGQLWLGGGNSRIEQVTDDAEGFRKTSKNEAVTDALGSGSFGVAFVDLNAVFAMLRDEPDASDWLDRHADVVEPLEALTMESVVDGQTFTWTMTLHTTIDDAWDTLMKRLITNIGEDEGKEMFGDLLPEADCDAAVAHMVTLTMAETPELDVQLLESVRAELLRMCEDGKVDKRCALAATNVQELDRCEVQ
jgi:hypothetical protein